MRCFLSNNRVLSDDILLNKYHNCRRLRLIVLPVGGNCCKIVIIIAKIGQMPDTDVFLSMISLTQSAVKSPLKATS